LEITAQIILMGLGLGFGYTVMAKSLETISLKSISSVIIMLLFTKKYACRL